MKIKLKSEKPEHVELIKAMGANDGDSAREAMKIFAALVGPLAKQVIDESDVISGLYDTLSVGEFEPRTIPLADYHNIDDPDYVRVSMSSRPGDLAYNQMTGADDIAFSTAYISAAIAFYKKYLKAGRIAHAEAGIRKLINEVRYKVKRQAIQPILDSLANSETNDRRHIIRSNTANQLGLADFNRLQTMAARILTSGLGDTPAGLDNATRAIDLLIMSPEMIEEIRAMAYEPMNTRGVPDTAESTALAAPESVRESVYNSGGIPSIYGTEIVQLNEMGLNQDFNTIFDALAGSVEYPDAGEASGSSNTTAFNGTNEEFILGVSRKVDVNGLLKVEINDSETGSAFNVMPDDQFRARDGKTGMWGQAEMGFMSVEPRNLFGLIV
jgi:hypothetical protein